MTLRDTSIKIHKGVDADNCICNLYNGLENVTKLKDFLGINSLDEHSCTARSATSRGVLTARANRRLRSTTGQYLTPAQSLTFVGPALVNAMPPSYFDLANARSVGGHWWLGAYVFHLNMSLEARSPDFVWCSETCCFNWLVYVTMRA